MDKKTIRDIEIEGKKILVRCDFNVPLDENNNITDNRRIAAALPTIRYLIEHRGKIILCSHLGRPKGEFNNKYSLKPVRDELSRLLEKDVKLAEDIIGESAKTLVDLMEIGDVVLLENVRFDAREEENNEEFAKMLASFADVYVNDAFGTAHRAHASTEGVSHFIPAVSGFLMEKEIEFLGATIENPVRPFVAILGGAKVSDKIGVIDNLLDKVDTLIIGGGMAYTFLKSMGFNIGKSLCEEEQINLAISLREKAKAKNVNMLLPLDNVAAKEISEDAEVIYINGNDIPEDLMALDIGERTITSFKEALKDAKTVVWNGPMGYSEIDNFANGTRELAEYLASLDQTITIVGGGDSAAAIEKLGLNNSFTHISTGGGASLEFLEGKKLPGVECLLDK